MPRPRPLHSICACALAMAALAGCHRRPQFTPGSDNDSTAVSDSATARLQSLSDRWEQPDGGDDAARLTGAVLLEDLRAHARAEPQLDWADRARSLLDSLGIGAEVAGTRCALAVNLFARSNPGAGSWPWAFWCGARGIEGHSIEGGGMALLAVSARGLYGQPPKPPGTPGVAVLFGRRAATGAQPILYAYRPEEGGLELAQTLGPDSLGGAGTGAFETVTDTVVLTTRTWRGTPHFDECPTCPHVERVHRFRWAERGFERVADATVPSPYATFVGFIAALMGGDASGAEARVSDPVLVDAAKRAQFDQPRGSWRVAPQTDPRAGEITFFRGGSEAWHVRFERRGADWVIAAFEPTSRTVE